MKELVPGVVEASHEKHIPVAKVEGNLVKVSVGSVEHPMAEEHSILWVALESDKGLYRKHLEVGAAPEAVFALADEKPIAVYAYCNLHGLWKQEL
jgi:superoxide reductase